MLVSLLLIALGFVLLIKGADWMVGGSSSLAKKFQVPDLVIGLTVVAFGTSAPELVVNSIASFENQSDIILGNVIGSNNFNLFVILGIVGLIYPVSVNSSTIRYEIPISLLVLVLLYFLGNDFFTSGDKVLSRWDGLILAVCFGGFLFYIFKQLQKEPEENYELSPTMSKGKITLLILSGLAGLVIGGKLVVDSAVDIANSLGISKKIIGLTIVAAGTSLPELTTSVVAAFKKNSDIAIGNVVGSNIFNILLILSISAFIRPVAYDAKFNFDIYLLAGGTIFLLLAMFIGGKKKLDRWEAGLLMVTFIIYTYYLIS